MTLNAIPTPAEIRAWLQDQASPLDHPTKSYRSTQRRPVPPPHKFGKIVYFEGGAVGGLFNGKFLIVKGETHEVSLFALANHLGMHPLSTGVRVNDVGEKRFYDVLRGDGKL